jgi:hypothetical protein
MASGDFVSYLRVSTTRQGQSGHAAYSKKKFSGDSDRVAFLFELYHQILSPLESKKHIRWKAAH